MRKECRTLYGLFVVLIVFCVTLPAISQQPKQGSAVIEYTETVNLSELVKTVDKLSGSIDTLTKTQEPLIKDIGDLKVQIARIDERTSNILAGMIGLFVTIVGGLILQNRSVKKQMSQYIPQSAPPLEELDQKDQEEQSKYEDEYKPEGVTS